MGVNGFVRLVNFVTCLFMVISSAAFAGELSVDTDTLLLLHCNGTLSGEDGETPTTATDITYSAGIHSQATDFGSGNNVSYNVDGNFDGEAGTLEFWIKPAWDGDDGQNHWVLAAGGVGGILIGKDGGNFWRIILNRLGANENPELGAGTFVNEWSLGEWHHAVFTWDASEIRVYIDGERVSTEPVTFKLPAIDVTDFSLGSDYTSGPTMALLDEIRISSRARSDEEIWESYLAGLTVYSISISPPTVELLETWWATPTVSASTNHGAFGIPSAALAWSSTYESVSTVDDQGRIVGHLAGSATLTGELNGATDTVGVTVTAPALPPETNVVDPYLSRPADGARWIIPVVILRYLPTQDGINVDFDETGWSQSLANLENRIDRFTIETKFMLEEGSRFRGYQERGLPSIGYQVLHIQTLYEEFPKGHQKPGEPWIFFPDYYQVLTRANAQYWVEERGVKEFWIWGYHHDDIEHVESNMSSPLTGDISNSWRFPDDLPVFDRTFTLYGYNFTRTSNESVHNHGHQLEAILSHANELQDGNSHLFWRQFSGRNSSDVMIKGRCGNIHFPTNTFEEYNYSSMELVESDCGDWTPDKSGVIEWVNADTWGSLVYPWPDYVPQDDLTQHQYYMWWMQNMPGRGNGIAHVGGVMTDWWVFTGDWDAAIARGVGLYGDDTCSGTPDQLINSQVFNTGQVVEACRSIVAGPDVVVSSIEPVRFVAGESVQLGSEFLVEQGATFMVVIDPSLNPF